MSKTSTDATGTAALACAARQDTHEEATRVLVMRPALALQFRIYLAVSLIQMKCFGLRLHSWNAISLNMG